jgi:uncharacterized protein YuzE
MKIAYYAETDSLYIDLGTGPSVESREVSPGVVIDLDQQGNITGIDIDHASRLDSAKLPLLRCRSFPEKRPDLSLANVTRAPSRQIGNIH